MNSKNDDWICAENRDDDYRIARYEVRTKGKKPLVLETPTFEQIVFVTQQYLNISVAQTRRLIILSVIETPDPDIEWHLAAQKTLRYLEADALKPH